MERAMLKIELATITDDEYQQLLPGWQKVVDLRFGRSGGVPFSRAATARHYDVKVENIRIIEDKARSAIAALRAERRPEQCEVRTAETQGVSESRMKGAA